MSTPNNNSLATIVIVTYNSSGSINKLLKSLEKNKDNIDQVIIVNNYSQDIKKTISIINRYKRKRVVNYVVHNTGKNFGFAKACNIGSHYSKTEYILFINPDAVLNSNSLETLQNHMANNNSDIIGGKCISLSGITHRTAVLKPDFIACMFELSNLGKILGTTIGAKHFYIDKKYLNGSEDCSATAVSGAFMLVKSSVFKALNGFDERYFMYLEDVDLGIRARRMGFKVIYCPHSTIQHEGGRSSENKYKISHTHWYMSRKTFIKIHFNIIEYFILFILYNFEEFLLKIRVNYVH